LSCYLGLLSSPALAQAPTPPSQAEQAAFALLQQRQWTPAASGFKAVTRKEPDNGRAWFRLGLALQGGNRDTEALTAFEKAIALGFNVGGASFNAAKLHARRQQPEKALEYLERMASAGGGSPRAIAADTDFVSLRSDPRYTRVLARADEARYPCKHRAEYKQFDFWAGHWDVFIAGALVGTNRVDRMDEGCVLLENWDAQGAQLGTSLNYYDPSLSKWRQIYIWDAGRATEWTGGLEGRVMRFLATTTTPAGARVRQRMTFEPLSPDSVTQVIEQSADDGATWTTIWNSVYVRKKP
jgi:tetratricopeptide (TPR) repeat protein